jgi:hypothetical protein
MRVSKLVSWVVLCIRDLEHWEEGLKRNIVMVLGWRCMVRPRWKLYSTQNNFTVSNLLEWQPSSWAPWDSYQCSSVSLVTWICYINVECVIRHTHTKLRETNQLTPRRKLLEKPTIYQLVKNFYIFYETRRFRTILTRAHHWADIRESSPHPHTLFLSRSILILSSDYA